jgi:pyruvate dehydrogenase E1 component alpha subunit/2-oxoisovalerate dehydrogenase E1 component alpha subunit
MAKQSTSEEYTVAMPEGLDLDRREALELYRFLLLNRMLDERLGILYRQGKVVGGLYSSLGQEACSVGTAYALEDGDFLAPMIRNMGSMLVRGTSALEVMAQYCAREIGPTRGKDLNLHFGSLERGLVAPISVVGALVPVMAGVALEMKLRAKKTVGLTYVGDGAMSTTDFHEGMNFAAVHRLPLIVVLENNGWAYSTATWRQANVENLVVRAKGYGCHGEVADGNDVLAMLDVTRRARARCVGGDGPVLIEAKTFRRRGHAEHDDAGYVPAQERARWEQKDPLDGYRRYLLGPGGVSSDELDDIRRRIDEELEASVETVLSAPFPEPKIAQEDVYA